MTENLAEHPLPATEAAQRLKSAAVDNPELNTSGFQPSAAFELFDCVLLEDF